MSKTAKPSQAKTRPPVKALQYEKLSLSVFDLCNRQLDQLDTLVTLAASICRNPSITIEERQNQRTLLELLVRTGERYRAELECDRELFQVIALDAKGIAQSRITASHATKLLEDAAQIAAQDHSAEEDDNSTLCEDADQHDPAAVVH